MIAGRALMGIGAAMIFPATLAILTNVFRDPGERAKAIGIWSAVSGVAVAAGPITGGWLLENFWWGSVFFINVPITILVAAVGLAARSGITRARRAARSTAPASSSRSRRSPRSSSRSSRRPSGDGCRRPRSPASPSPPPLLTAFVVWELRVEHPMLPVSIFRNLRFSAASVAITSAFFALFGFIFLITQYFQLVRGYGPLEAGLRTLPVAVSIAVASVLAPRLVDRFGTTAVVRSGLMLLATAFVWISFRVEVDTSYLEIAGQMVFLGVGLGATTAPATESIMGSLSADKAGIGSAVNDTTRELGGTLGVAIIGSVFSSVYINALDDSAADGTFAQLPPEAQELTRESVGAARIVANELGSGAAPYLG